MTLTERHKLIWRSYRSLPGWVQIWVGAFLVPANAASFFLLDTLSGQLAAGAAIFVVVTNGPLVYWYCGMNRALSIPHLVAWIPLHVALVARLSGWAGPMDTAEAVFVWVLLAINSVSLAFDVLDSWRWWQGERETPGVG